jgi:hypothetical protein
MQPNGKKCLFRKGNAYFSKYIWWLQTQEKDSKVVYKQLSASGNRTNGKKIYAA